MQLVDPAPGIDSLFRSTSPTNYSGYKSPQADAALDQARTAATPEARRTTYTERVKIVNQDVPLFVWQEAVTTVVHRSAVTGLTVVNRRAAACRRRSGDRDSVAVERTGRSGATCRRRVGHSRGRRPGHRCRGGDRGRRHLSGPRTRRRIRVRQPLILGADAGVWTSVLP